MKAAVTILVLCVASLLALGMVMLYSAGMLHLGPHYLKLQLLWASVGILACVVVASVDYKRLKPCAPFFFAAALVLLALVKVAGVSSHGANRWLVYHGISFQPSEAAKIALILTLAVYGERHQQKMGKFKEGLLIPGCLAGAILALIFIEPDRGTTALLAGVTFSMLWVAGSNMLVLLPVAAVGIAGFVYSLIHDPMRLGRIMAWLNPENNKTGQGYQAWHATLALGSGGTTGLGLGSGRQKLGFVPENHTDFIFSVIGEELGLIATLAVVVVFFIFVICGTLISLRARDRFGLLLGTGLTLLIGCQAFINIGVVTSLLPNKGLALPFVSYGGSSLVMMLTCVGILLSIAFHSEPVVSTEEDESLDLPVSAFA